MYVPYVCTMCFAAYYEFKYVQYDMNKPTIFLFL
jgi:hypothetical protein